MESFNNPPVPSDSEKEIAKNESAPISPAIKQYFVDMGPEKTYDLLSRFSKESLGVLKQNILDGNLGYVTHLMQTAQMEASGYSFEQAALDYTSMDPAKRDKGGKAMDKLMVDNFSTAAKYEKHDPSLPQGASEILGIIFGENK